MEKNNMTEQLLEILHAGDAAALKKFYDSMEPYDYAQLIEDLDDDDLKPALNLLEEDDLAEVMKQADEKQQLRMAKFLDNDRLLEAFEHMQKDDIVDMLGEFPTWRRKEVINLMKKSDRQIITRLLQYDEESAGGIMTTDYIALHDDLTVARGLAKIREIGPRTEVIETIYVTNKQRQLIGSADLRDFLTSPKDRLIRSITDPHVISVTPETDQEEVAKQVSKYDLKSIPVVSRTGQILGIITVDDIIDVIVDEYNEDILQMSGVSKEENLDTTLGESIRMRLPWLLVNLATAFLAAFTVTLFESTIAKVVALSSIMTIVSGMGGNAATQTMSILIRQLAAEEITFKEAIRPFCKELLLGVIDGAACGLVTAVIVIAMNRNIWLGVVVLIAMIGNLLVAGIFGFLVPIIIKKLHADPAVASSIFITTATDVLGFFIFLGLATIFMPLLLK